MAPSNELWEGPRIAGRHVYVDESKRAGYILAAATVPDPATMRKVVRDLQLPGQRRIHMKHEQPRRRRAIIAALVETSVRIIIYDAGRRYATDLAPRAACLGALVDDLAGAGDAVQLVIEQDDSLVQSDRHELYRLVRQAGLSSTVEYRHGRAHDEPLLALPDVSAWCWARSGDWRRRIAPILANVRYVGL